MSQLEKLLEGAFKIVLSRGDGAFRKIVINQKSGRQGVYYQAEKYTDRQVFHENIPPEALPARMAEWVPGEFKQADAFSEGLCRTLRVSKKGKETLSESRTTAAKPEAGHNRQKIICCPRARSFPRWSIWGSLRPRDGWPPKCRTNTARSTGLSSWWTTPSAATAAGTSPSSTSAAASPT